MKKILGILCVVSCFASAMDNQGETAPQPQQQMTREERDKEFREVEDLRSVLYWLEKLQAPRAHGAPPAPLTFPTEE